MGKTKGSQETRMGTSKNEYWHKETTYKHHQKLGNGTTKNQEITFKSKRFEMRFLEMKKQKKKKWRKKIQSLNRIKYANSPLEYLVNFLF